MDSVYGADPRASLCAHHGSHWAQGFRRKFGNYRLGGTKGVYGPLLELLEGT